MPEEMKQRNEESKEKEKEELLAETCDSRLKDTEREESNCSVICEQRVIPRYPKNFPTTFTGINEERRKARGAAKLNYLFANSKLRAGSESSSHCAVLKNVALDEGPREIL